MTGDPQIFYKQSERKFQAQQSLIAKILYGQLSTSSKYLPAIVIYNITQFLFHNPLKTIDIFYSCSSSRKLAINKKYLLKEMTLDDQLGQNTREKKQKKCAYRSSFITITKTWNSIKNYDLSYAEVMAKGKLFLHFFENIKLKIKPIKKIDAIQDYQAYKKQQKQIKKYYDLISDNLQIIFQQFQEVFRYQSNKKINDVVIKSFKSLMNKNIVIVKVEENYNGNSHLGIEGKYIYVENNHRIGLKPYLQEQTAPVQRANNKAFKVWLKHNTQEGWRIGFPEQELQFLDEVRFPLQRKNKILFNKKLEQYLQQDFWITKL